MLPHHQPFVVAEQFQMLEALYPGRVDLGVGRTLGFTEPVRQALRQSSADRERFEADITELRRYLSRSAPVTVRPATVGAPSLFVLATGHGVETAARLGLPVVIGGPILHSPELAATVAAYRREFRPSEAVPAPEVMVSLDVYLADTADEARELALPEAWAMARSRETGEFGPLEPIQDIRAVRWSERTRARVERSLAQAVAGPPRQVSAQLAKLAERTGSEELLVSTSTYDRDALAQIDAGLAHLLLG